MKKDKPLILNSFSKSYGQQMAVKDVSLELKRGEVFGFLGPNGAGKSTAIRSILNFIAPTEGSIKIFGLDSVKDSVKAKRLIGYLAGDISLYNSMTGRQVIEYLSSLGRTTDWAFVDELAGKLEVQLDRPIGSLSKGNKQKVGLIQAFMHKPDLIVLDEPTSGLDPLMKQVFYDMILEMRAQGLTIFLSSHDLSEVQKICDRAAFIRDGKLIAIEDVKNAKGLNLRSYRVIFNKRTNPTNLLKVKGVSLVNSSENSRELELTVKGSVAPFIKELAKLNPADLDELETTLEDIFMHYYESEADNV